MHATPNRRGFPLIGQLGARSLRYGAARYRSSRLRGFTMVELLITLAVLAVVTIIAVPSFKTLTLSNRLTTTADSVVAALGTARLEAIKRNASTQFCTDSTAGNTSSTNPALGTECGTDAGAVVAMSGASAVHLRAAVSGIDSTVKFNGSPVAIRFSAQGLGYKVGDTTPYTGTVADICTASLSSDNHRVISMAAGSAITTKPRPGDCP